MNKTKNVSFSKCKKICNNLKNCTDLTYDAALKVCKTNGINVSINTNELNGIYNIYQQGNCINSKLFNKNSNISELNAVNCDDFFFSPDGKIIYADPNDVSNVKCVQNGEYVNFGPCSTNENQKWIFDNNSIKNNDECLTIKTNVDNVSIITENCVSGVNQYFDVIKTPINNPVEEGEAETVMNVEIEMETEAKMENVLKMINSKRIERFETDCEINYLMFYIYFISLILCLIFVINK